MTSPASRAPALRIGNFEELRGGHRNLPGTGIAPGQSRGVVSLAKAKGRIPAPAPKFQKTKAKR